MWLVVAVLLIVGMLWTTREGFIPTVDSGNNMRTKALEDSSYRQETNNFQPSPTSFPPMLGTLGKDQLNQWKGVVV